MNIFNYVKTPLTGLVMDGIKGSLVNWNVTSHDINGVINN